MAVCQPILIEPRREIVIEVTPAGGVTVKSSELVERAQEEAVGTAVSLRDVCRRAHAELARLKGEGVQDVSETILAEAHIAAYGWALQPGSQG